MDGEHILANMRHLHSDAAQQTLEVLARLESVASGVVNAAQQVEKGKTALHRQNEALLMDQVKEITEAIKELKSVEENIQKVAANAARAILMDDDGPVKQLEKLVAQQNRALGYLNSAAASYTNRNLTVPAIIACSIASVIGGVIAKHFF